MTQPGQNNKDPRRTGDLADKQQLPGRVRTPTDGEFEGGVAALQGWVGGVMVGDLNGDGKLLLGPGGRAAGRLGLVGWYLLLP